MNHLSTDCRAVITRFIYNMNNGLLAYPLLEGSDYRLYAVKRGAVV